MRFIFKPAYRAEYRQLQSQLDQWRRSTGGIMESQLGNGGAGNVVFFGWSRFEHVLAESVVRKAFERANYTVKVLTDPSPGTRAVYAAMGSDGLKSFTSFCPVIDENEAKQILDSFTGGQTLVEYSFDGVSVGKYVSSTMMRRTRQGSIDHRDPKLRNSLITGLATSIASVRGAQRMISELAPKAVVLVDRGYTPYGEVFDVCVNAGIQVITWNIAHRNNTLMLKRYHKSNRLEHPSSLSDKSWESICVMPWGKEEERELHKELADSYNNGEWYGEAGTQFGKRAWTREEISTQLGLDPAKKTGVIYAHIFWDATFFWGVDIFKDYADWFIQTVKAACANDRLNWLIKVHPANVVKNYRDGVKSDPSEIIALREYFGDLPEHVRVIPADSEITTWSLLCATDYCLTVRGTVGIEAALLGKTVLTAGTGRYDRLGFTMDFDSPEAYLECLSRLENVPKPDPKMKEKAMRFGYGIFLCRPVRLKVFDLRFLQNENATLTARLNSRTVGYIKQSKEIIEIAQWLEGNADDYLDRRIFY